MENVIQILSKSKRVTRKKNNFTNISSQRDFRLNIFQNETLLFFYTLKFEKNNTK